MRLSPCGAQTPHIVLKRMPAAPGAALTLTLYPVGGAHLVGLQVRARGAEDDELGADTLLDAAYQILHGRKNTVFGAVSVPLIAWRSGANFGPDGSGRDEATANYYLTTDRAADLVDHD